MTALEFIVAQLLIFTSSLLSASEVALFSLSRFQLRTLASHFNRAHERITSLIKDPPGLLIVILVSNEIVNVSLSTIFGNFVARQFADKTENIRTFIAIGISTPIILIFCESTPKALGARLNQIVAPLTSRWIYLLYWLFAPIRISLKFIFSLFSRAIHGTPSKLLVHSKNDLSRIKEEEVLLLAEEAYREGTIHSRELNLIRNVFDLDNLKVKELMLPIEKYQTLPAGAQIEQALEHIAKFRQMKTPIWDHDKKEIIGILYTKDLIAHRLDHNSNRKPVEHLARKPIFIPPEFQVYHLFRKLRNMSSQIAIVKSKDGPIGVVTMDLVIEEILKLGVKQ